MFIICIMAITFLFGLAVVIFTEIFLKEEEQIKCKSCGNDLTSDEIELLRKQRKRTHKKIPKICYKCYETKMTELLGE